jgi:uncharacterized protein (TIGR02466 family)|tara:strand:- start:230 stop:838 length:609 start_codon:yes stop_codon:yes gene_type:complete
MNILPIFPSLIIKEKIKDYDKYKDELIQFSYEQLKKDPIGISKSNNGGWHSQSKYANSQNPVSSIIINLIKSILNNKNVFNIKDLSKAKMQMWININKPGDFNNKHNHPGSDLSGVFWVKSLQKSGNLTFHSPNFMTQFGQINSIKDEIGKKLFITPTIEIEPLEGVIVLFPSDLTHAVQKNNSDEDRISVSFNIDLRNCVT